MSSAGHDSHQRVFKIALACACLLIANGVLQWVIDSDLGITWPHNVLRNWDDVGFSALKGKLVDNPGGYEALTHPHIYPGHSADSLYTAYLIGRLFAWTGLNALPFHVITTLIVLIAVWRILGGGEWGLWVGGLFILTPGYLLWPTIIDPNTVSVLAGVPYFALMWWRLRQRRLGAVDVIFLLGVTIAFTMINWTSALVHGVVFVTFAAGGRISWRRLAIYAISGAAAAGVMLLIGLKAKLSAGTGGHEGFAGFLGMYAWGNGGYSEGAGTTTLLVRLGFVNALALLPFWILWGWSFLRSSRRDFRIAARSLAPLAMATIDIVALRNYFCQHPWMASPLFLLGALLSLFIMTGAARSAEATNVLPSATALWRPAWTVMLVAGFGFGLVVLSYYRAHNAKLISLVAMVRSHTRRTDQILIATNRDPELLPIAAKLPESLDRLVTTVGELSNQAQVMPSFLLTTQAENGMSAAAVSVPDSIAEIGPVKSGLAWYSRFVARRKPGDKIEVPDTYYLYSWPQRSNAGRQAEGLPPQAAAATGGGP